MSLLSTMSTRNKILAAAGALLGTTALVGAGYGIASLRKKAMRKLQAHQDQQLQTAVDTANEAKATAQEAKQDIAARLEDVKAQEARVAEEREALERAYGKQRRNEVTMVTLNVKGLPIEYPELSGRLNTNQARVDLTAILANTNPTQYDGVTIREGLQAYLDYIGRSLGSTQMYLGILEAQFVSNAVKVLGHHRDLTEPFTSNHIELLCELVK